MKTWYRIRIWWHRLLYRPLDIAPAGEDELLINCSCGGCAQVRRNPDASATVEYASCPLWRWVHSVRDPLPVARLLP